MRTLRRIVPLLVWLAAAAAQAASWESTFSVSEGLPATFSVPFPVAHAGRVVIEAKWAGPRLLFFGVDGPREPALARRSGPSPQRLEIEVGSDEAGPSTVWKLTIKALAARGVADGRVTVTVPDAPEVVAAREAALHPPPPPPPPPPPWAVAQAPPPGASAEMLEVYRALEAYRAATVAAKDAPPDDCRWQRAFLEYSAAARDRLGALSAPPDLTTLRYFGRLASAIRSVDALRHPSDPVLSGPVPEDVDARREWLMQHNEKIRPIERRLDELGELLRGGHAPTLAEQAWVPRLNACLMACERYFDERVRVGGSGVPDNRELAAAQWDRILAAGAVFEAFGPYLKEPRNPALDHPGSP